MLPEEGTWYPGLHLYINNEPYIVPSKLTISACFGMIGGPQSNTKINQQHKCNKNITINLLHIYIKKFTVMNSGCALLSHADLKQYPIVLLLCLCQKLGM